MPPTVAYVKHPTEAAPWKPYPSERSYWSELEAFCETPESAPLRYAIDAIVSACGDTLSSLFQKLVHAESLDVSGQDGSAREMRRHAWDELIQVVETGGAPMAAVRDGRRVLTTPEVEELHVRGAPGSWDLDSAWDFLLLCGLLQGLAANRFLRVHVQAERVAR